MYDDLLQQHLPFTVLKPAVISNPSTIPAPPVATALTVYGIETRVPSNTNTWLGFVATALTVYGIETRPKLHRYIVDPE